jgi:Alkylmercury lyase
MLLFRSEEHVDKWCKDWRFERGAVLDLEKCWRLAQRWYGADRRDAGWRRFTPLESHNIFQQLGLVGDFWKVL